MFSGTSAAQAFVRLADSQWSSTWAQEARRGDWCQFELSRDLPRVTMPDVNSHAEGLPALFGSIDALESEFDEA